MILALSTTVCSVPARPALLLRRCRDLGAERGLGLALDTRLPLAVQRELLAEASRVGLSVVEVALPLVDAANRPLARPLSDDRGERLASAQAMIQTLEFASICGVSRVILHPWALDLHVPVSALLSLFARGEALPDEPLREERRDRSAAALDRLRGVLDPVFEVASGRGVQLCVAGPAIWPHQLPNAEEVEALQREFAGAPLVSAHFSDWNHAHATLFGDPSSAGAPGTAAVLDQLQISAGGLVLPVLRSAGSVEGRQDQAARPPARVVCPLRLADACGTRLRLPLDTGESNWRAALANNPPDAVLAFDEQTTLAEVARSREAIATAIEEIRVTS